MNTTLHIIEAFACGLAFAMGVTSWFFILDMATSKGRAEIKAEALEYRRRVEERLAVQVTAMVACLEEIKKRKDQP